MLNLSFFLLLTNTSCKHNLQHISSYKDSVTIYRDAYGVPHVYGDNDASAAFGFAYAQAEDNFLMIEENFIRSIGKSTEIVGENGIMDDWLNRSLRIVELSKQELEQLSVEVQNICIAYAEGLNYYLKNHPEIQPKLIKKFEAWHILAFIRYLYYQRVLLLGYSKIPFKNFEYAFKKINPINSDVSNYANFVNKKVTGEGSNSWAVNGSKSVSGNALLLINPHLSFFGPAQVYEAHIMSKSGWNFTGYTRFGFPFPYVGFGEKLGWASTDNQADLVDAYVELFQKKNDGLYYSYDDKWFKTQEWTEEIRIKNGNNFITKTLSCIATHHGPVVGFDNKNFLSVKMAKYEDPGWLEQWYLMTKATNFDTFKSAASRLDVQFGNYLYADVEGNIFYVYNGAIPIRSEQYDWSKPVDGTITETEWLGYHSLEEIPQVLNPQSGWIQNCNGTPFLSTDTENPKQEDYPNYMVPDIDNHRSEHSRKILNKNESFTYESFIKKSYSTYLLSAEKDLLNLFKEWDKIPKNKKTVELSKAMNVLKEWDFTSTTSSIATTLYIFWAEKMNAISNSYNVNSHPNIHALELAIDVLLKEWGTWQVPWGNINRIQRVEANENFEYQFSDSLFSFPVAGAPSWAGPIFTFWTDPSKKTKKRYGTGGNSYVSVVEFGPEIKAKSLHHFGSSGNPNSSHYFDQAEIYSKGEYKPAYLTLDDVKENAVNIYKPSELDKQN